MTTFSSITAAAWKDLRFASRVLIKSRSLAATALTTLALCIGANTAIFSVLYSLVIKPLPFHQPKEIVEVYNSFPKAGLDHMPSNVVQFLDFKEHAPAFAYLALIQFGDFTIGENDRPTRISGAFATAEFFDVLGVQPLLGHFYTAANQQPTTDKVIVLTESFWNAHFQRNPSVIGQKLNLDGENYEIVGVAPHLLEAFNAKLKFIRPLSWDPHTMNQQARYFVTPSLFGRLKPGAKIAEALAQVAALEQHYYDQAPPGEREFLDRTGHAIRVDEVQVQRVAPFKTAAYLLQGGVLFVLLIGCVNVANLLLARSNARRGELATRVALGASRGAIARQLLIESTLLSAVGSILGLGLAWLALGSANHYIKQLLPASLPIVIDARVLVFTGATTVVIALAIGILPLIHVVGGNLLSLIQAQSRGASSGRGVRAWSDLLVVAQMAFALILLTGAGLLIRSFAQAMAVKPGFDTQHLFTAQVALPAAYQKEGLPEQFAQRLHLALTQIPGASAAFATTTPYLTGLPILAFTLRDYTLPPGAAQPGVFICGATPTYLETMHIPLLEGRWFNDGDTAKGRGVFVVDESFAKKYFKGGSAVGQHLSFGQPSKPEDWPEIVGVVGDVKHNGIEEKSGNPYLYYPLLQNKFYGLSIFLRTDRPVADTVAELQHAIKQVDASIPVFGISSMEGVIDTSLDNRRALMLPLVTFAGVALLLSAIGVYGVLAYDVSQRTREIGIRGAIGATKHQIISMILRQGLGKTVAGLVLGLVGALALNHLMTSLLFQVKPTDPMAYIIVSLLLFAVAFLASYLPAHRAARIDPSVALRDE